MVMGLMGFGPGGAGAAAAVGVVGMEVFMMIIFLWHMGKLAIDRRNSTAFVKSVLVALAVGVLDHFLAPLGAVRLVIDLFAYTALALLVQVEQLRDIRYAVSVVRSRGRAAESFQP
jgi:hypothetical protein